MGNVLLALIPLIAITGFYGWLLVTQKRRFGEAFAALRRYERTVMVPVSHEDADGLVHRGLRAVYGGSGSDRGDHGSFVAEALECQLTEANEATWIRIRGGSQGIGWSAMLTRNIRAGRERVDRIADWLEQAPLDGPLAEDHPSYRKFGVL
jgi:hypothetical protein